MGSCQKDIGANFERALTGSIWGNLTIKKNDNIENRKTILKSVIFLKKEGGQWGKYFYTEYHLINVE